MISDQGQACERDNVFGVSEIKGKMVPRPQPEDDLIPQFITANKSVKEFDCEFFLVSLAHGQPAHDKGYNILKVHEVPQNYGELRGYLKKYKGLPTYQSFANFHLLVYLAKILDIGSALGIAEDVALEKPINEFIYELVEGKAT